MGEKKEMGSKREASIQKDKSIKTKRTKNIESGGKQRKALEIKIAKQEKDATTENSKSAAAASKAASALEAKQSNLSNAKSEAKTSDESFKGKQDAVGSAKKNADDEAKAAE